MATLSRVPSKNYDLDVTIVSAKHLKNVNWRNGDLKPYVIFWIDPDRRLATKSDESGSTKPVWNERFVLPLTHPPPDSPLTLEIFHSKPTETPKPLVGTIHIQLGDTVDSDESVPVRAFELRRPSGRPHGKIYLKLALRYRPEPNYQPAPPSSYYYSIAPPAAPIPTSARDYMGYTPSVPYTSHLPPPSLSSLVPPPPPPASPYPPPPPPPSHSYQYGGYADPYSSYYPGYYLQRPQPPTPRPIFERQQSYVRPGPSAPVDYSPYDQKRGSKMGLGTGLVVGAVAGSLAGLALDGGIKYEEEKITEKAENEVPTSDSYRDYCPQY